jgi:hypothetical protein
MNVRILVGANAYACITHGTTSMDVRLAPGRAPSVSLRESAEELREKAKAMLHRATIMEEAADMLKQQNK